MRKSVYVLRYVGMKGVNANISPVIRLSTFTDDRRNCDNISLLTNDWLKIK